MRPPTGVVAAWRNSNIVRYYVENGLLLPGRLVKLQDRILKEEVSLYNIALKR